MALWTCDAASSTLTCDSAATKATCDGWLYAAASGAGVGTTGGGGGGGLHRGRRIKLDRELTSIIDEVAAEVVYGELIETAPAPVKAKAKAIVKPYRSNRSDRPAIDWTALQADVERVEKLWNMLLKLRQQEADDETWFMLGD